MNRHSGLGGGDCVSVFLPPSLSLFLSPCSRDNLCINPASEEAEGTKETFTLPYAWYAARGRAQARLRATHHPCRRIPYPVCRVLRMESAVHGEEDLGVKTSLGCQ